MPDGSIFNFGLLAGLPDYLKTLYGDGGPVEGSQPSLAGAAPDLGTSYEDMQRSINPFGKFDSANRAVPGTQQSNLEMGQYGLQAVPGTQQLMTQLPQLPDNSGSFSAGLNSELGRIQKATAKAQQEQPKFSSQQPNFSSLQMPQSQVMNAGGQGSPGWAAILAGLLAKPTK